MGPLKLEVPLPIESNRRSRSSPFPRPHLHTESRQMTDEQYRALERRYHRLLVAAEVLRRRYLGQVSWSRLCQAAGVGYNSLPDEVQAR